MLKPFNLKQWIDNNQDALKPPVCNKAIFMDKDFIVMVVGGPNQRKDFHYNEGAEIFYQIKGQLQLKIKQNETIEVIEIMSSKQQMNQSGQQQQKQIKDLLFISDNAMCI